MLGVYFIAQPFSEIKGVSVCVCVCVCVMSSFSIYISDDEVYIIVDVISKWQVGHLK